MAAKRQALGRGLSALIPEVPPAARRRDDYFICPIEKIVPRRSQPRRFFDEGPLEELVASLKQQGMVQPLVVRSTGDGTYGLIAGERRWRAAQKAGMREVPVVIRDVDDLRAFELALVENLQREDLNAIEEAEAYARLIEQHGYTQDRLARQIGKDRSTVTNSLRLLKLPEPAQHALIAGTISTGHARALLGLDDIKALHDALAEVIAKGFSVRQTETLINRMRAGDGDRRPVAVDSADEPMSANVRDLQERLCRVLGTRVRLVQRAGGKKGRIEINYGSIDELDRLLEVLLR